MQRTFRISTLASGPSWRFDGRRLLSILALWQHRHRSRRRLAALDARELEDVGLSREQCRDECGKPFWRA
jgi:uncharacterized protein YjiS (DUF1127 family)